MDLKMSVDILVMQYSMKFTELSRFVTYFVGSKRIR